MQLKSKFVAGSIFTFRRRLLSRGFFGGRFFSGGFRCRHSLGRLFRGGLVLGGLFLDLFGLFGCRHDGRLDNLFEIFLAHGRITLLGHVLGDRLGDWLGHVFRIGSLSLGRTFHLLCDDTDFFIIFQIFQFLDEGVCADRCGLGLRIHVLGFRCRT